MVAGDAAGLVADGAGAAEDPSVVGVGDAGVASQPTQLGDLGGQFETPGLGAVAVANGIAGGGDQPGQRCVGEVAEPAPGNEEGVGDRILGRGGRQVTKAVASTLSAVAS